MQLSHLRMYLLKVGRARLNMRRYSKKKDDKQETMFFQTFQAFFIHYKEQKKGKKPFFLM